MALRMMGSPYTSGHQARYMDIGYIHVATLGILDAVHLVAFLYPGASLVDKLPDCPRRLLDVRAVDN